MSFDMFDLVSDGPDRRPGAQRRASSPEEFVEALLDVPAGCCPGCGATFQSADTDAPGFVPQSVLDDRSAAGAKVEGGEGASLATNSETICQRCHGLRYQNRLPVEALRVGTQAQHEELQPEHFRELLRGLARRRCLVIAVVDLFDFDGSFTPDLAAIVGPSNPLIVVANKVDLLPRRAHPEDVRRWVRRACARHGVTRIASTHLVSCKSGVGLDKLLGEMQQTMRERRMDCYVVGAANAGKSSFLNRCLNHFAAKKGTGSVKRPGSANKNLPGRLTTSHLPGTTLDFVRVSLPSMRQGIFDTPGLIIPSQLTTLLTTSELSDTVPKKQTDVVTLSLKTGKSVLLGGLARLHMREGLPFSFTFYIANAVPIHPTTSDKAAATLAKHVGGLLAPPASAERLAELGAFVEQRFTVRGRGWDEVATDIVLPGLGWISVVGSGECTISVEVPQGVVVSSREPMLSGAEHYRTTGVKFTGTKLTTKRGGTKRRR